MYKGHYRFIDISEHTYLVDDSFPKISKHALNNSVFNVKYKVNVDGQKTLEDDLYEKLRN